MKIPPKFKKILDTDQLLTSVVYDVVTSFSPIYEDNKLYFFEEYTDHGIKHVEKVLQSMELIISDDTFTFLTPKEIALLILSAILHDIGMHIEYNTFKSMIQGGYDRFKIDSLDKYSWKELWNQYLSEAKRFSSSQKKNIFGNEFFPINEPDLSNKDILNGFDKKLIGEFIRRHHARIAHEIALGGIIGGENNILKFGNEKLNMFYKSLIGILSRSHGTKIRNTFKYLQSIANDGWRNPDDIHIVFLMVVLRIADYIQIDEGRVNPFLIKLKTFNSPFSLQEFKTHLAVSSISFNQPDKERIYVTCNPSNSEMFVKLKNLIKDIQNEFDVSWAVLGEVYGFLTSEPKIKFRRITSNLEKAEYLDKLDFVPQRIAFEVNNELSKLLVHPLYGNSPKYGVRELVQNSIDACLELDYLENKKGNNLYIPKIKVSIDKISNQSIFSIVDNGKGMSITEILNYFLKIGSSFRKSYAWKKEFSDESGHSLINRNGRFGIGVLAAYLMGDEINVETTHYSDPFTYYFTTKIDSDYIEIMRRKKENKYSGTKITININEDNLVKLLEYDDDNYIYYNDIRIKWTDWYVYDFPEVKYYLFGEEQENLFKLDLTNFKRFRSKDYEKIEWDYLKPQNKYTTIGNSAFVCNGIIVTRELKHEKGEFRYETFNKKGITMVDYNYVINHKPSILIEDKEGLFPIKLDRNDIDCEILPFERELLTEVSKDFIAKILTLKVEIKDTINKQRILYHDTELIYNINGYSFYFDYFIDELSDKYNFARIITSQNKISNQFLKFKNWFVYPQYNQNINLTYQENNVAPRIGGIILLKKKNYKELFESELKRISASAKKHHEILYQNNNYVIYNIYNYKNHSIILKNHNYFSNKIDNIESIQEINPGFFSYKGGEILNSLLEKYLGKNVIIPYDIKERKKIYSKAFRELKKFMMI